MCLIEAINDIQKEKVRKHYYNCGNQDLKGHLNGILTFDQKPFSHILFKLKITMAFMPT